MTETFNPRKPHDYDWDRSPTPPLDAVITALEADRNLWWVMGCGHHENLFDAAVDRMEQAESVVKATTDLREELNRQAEHPERGSAINIETRRIVRRLQQALRKKP